MLTITSFKKQNKTCNQSKTNKTNFTRINNRAGTQRNSLAGNKI